MKYFFDHLETIKQKIKGPQNSVLMFDFDGTLAAIVKHPKHVALKIVTKNLLGSVSKYFPVAIISGRELEDIEKMVGLPNLIYAGNHGMEWKIDGKYDDAKINPIIKNKIAEKEKFFRLLYKKYSGVEVRDKRMTLAIHYRSLDKKLIKKFTKETNEALSSTDIQEYFLAVKGKKVVELFPKIEWNKGYFAKFILAGIEKRKKTKVTPLYVGDDTSDEHAYEKLQKGVTVRVGKKQNSRAEYFIKRGEIDKLLNWLNDFSK